MEPSFAFAGPFDFLTDSGWCPCRLGTNDCGFEWSLASTVESARDVPSDGRRCVGLGGGSGPAAEEGAKGSRRKKVRDKRAPADLLRDWLTELAAGKTGAPAMVDGVVRSTPDDPLVAIKFSQGAILKARSWTVSTADGQTLSTAAMPSDMTPVEITGLDGAFERLVTILRSGPLTSATYDPEGFELSFAFPAGTFIAHPLRRSSGEPREAALTWTDRWELQHEGQRIYADMDDRTPIAGPF